MKQPQNIIPPRWATRLLSWYCRPELLEDLEGDLNEYFNRNVKEKSLRRARLIYIIDVFKFFRSYTVRKPEFINLLINWIMLGSYIKTSGRNIVRNKLFSTINIAGLAISMSVGLLTIGVLTDLFSYDKFHTNHSRIYRVISKYQFLDNQDDHFMATTSVKAALEINESFKMPEAVAFFRAGFQGDMKANEKTIPVNGYWANEKLFSVFSFQLLRGNAETALKEPFSMVLTEQTARKFFGDQDAMGKTITDQGRDYTVTGIIKDIPTFSNIKFDMLGSFSSRTILTEEEKREMAWDNIWGTWVYLLLPEDANLETLQANLNQLSVKFDPTVKDTHIELSIQPFDSIMMTDNQSNEIGPVMGSSAMWIFGGLSFVVILSACFNYANLSIARSLRRSREVGIRKVVGALKSQVLSQFVIEAVLISLIGLVFAFVIFLILRGYFLGIDPGFSRMLTLNLSLEMVLWFILFAVLVGVGAGFLPALFFAKVNAAQALKNLSSVLSFKKQTLRRALIVFQYTISIIFITCTIVIFSQYKHFMAFDLGFKTENIFNIELKGNNAELLKKDLSELPEVKAISISRIIPSVGNYWTTRVKYHANPDDSASVNYNAIDENYLPLHEHKLLAGRNFTTRGEDFIESEVIVNEQLLKRFNIAEQNPANAIDEILRVEGKDMKIIGVMKNFQYGRANDKAEAREVVMRYSHKRMNWINLKIGSTDLIATHDKIEAIWKKHDNVHPMEGMFYDEQLEEAFSGLQAAVKMAGFLAMLAVCIASMGLLGMVVFTTETRLKEISIRKVMGASEIGLLYLLGKGFITLLLIATLIGLPVTIIFFEQLLLPEIANHAPLSLIEMFAGVLGILFIALLMIGSQTIKVTRTNPADVLKQE
ncbi:MAG: FtsX-like permease family protein [Cyclobacteriaceae bacterium]|nr:FtsX-like permease family protein [Cyclobacteriaceae bacterium]